LLLVGLFACALTLRPQLVGASPLFPLIERDQHISNVVVGLLGTIPVLCMGVFAPLAPLLRSRLQTKRAIAFGIALIAGFGLLRAIAPSASLLIILTIGVGSGMGLAGALMPVMVKEHFHDRSLQTSSIYSAGMQGGAALSAVVAVPIAMSFGGWRSTLLAFSVVSVVIAVGWVALIRSAAGADGSLPVVGRDGGGVLPRHERQPRLSGTALKLALAFGLFGIYYYGLTSWLAASYVERGWSLSSAGSLLGLIGFGSLAAGFVLPAVSQRIRSRTRFGVVLAIGLLVAALAITLTPVLAYPAALLAGVANGALFPVLMASPVDMTAHAEDAGRVTALMLGVGYTLAAIAPTGLGAVRDLTGSFTPVLWLIVLAAAALLLVNLSFDAIRRPD
jgi:CP family cyanate transporter-like MFS transporter